MRRLWPLSEQRVVGRERAPYSAAALAALVHAADALRPLEAAAVALHSWTNRQKTRQKLDPKKLVNTCNSLTNFEYESTGNGNQVNLLTRALKFRKIREITSSELIFGGKTTVHCRPPARFAAPAY